MNIDGFISKIEDRSAVIGVIGLGYVGLPLLLTFAAKGFRTIGFDVDQAKCDRLNKGESYIRHITDESIKGMDKFEAVTDFSRIADTDAALICVPTPLTQQRDPDMTYIIATVTDISPHIHPDQLIVLESTTYPGTTEEIVVSSLETGSGLVAGKDFMVAYSPEREDPNNPKFSTATIPKVVGGLTPDCGRAAEALYGAVIETLVPVANTRTAEATKLMENIFRGVNIALVNELKIIFDRMDIDIWDVIEAAKTKPFGFMPFYPGPGLGGHCIPIDPFYLAWKAREYGINTRFIELAGEINRAMPNYVLHKTMEALNQRGKALKDARLLLIGMAYKANVDDTRESSSLKLMKLFESHGAGVAYHDPFVPVIPVTREHADLAGRKSTPLEQAPDFDCVLIATAHSNIDYADLTSKAQLVVDTRNVCPEAENVIKA